MVLQSAVNRPAAPRRAHSWLAARRASVVIRLAGALGLGGPRGTRRYCSRAILFRLHDSGGPGSVGSRPAGQSHCDLPWPSAPRHMAMIKISWKSCSAALPVTRTIRPVPSNAVNFSKTTSRRDSRANGENRIALSIRGQDFQCDSPGPGPDEKNAAPCGISLAKEKKLWF